MDKHLLRLKAEMWKMKGMGNAHPISESCVSHKETLIFFFYKSSYHIDF